MNHFVTKNSQLTESQKQFINSNRQREFGAAEIKNFSTDYEPDAQWHFLAADIEIVAFCCLRPILIKLGIKQIKIIGLSSFISVVKNYGYGRNLVQTVTQIASEQRLSVIAFTKEADFFVRCGMQVARNFIKRFVYINSNGQEITDDDGDGAFCDVGGTVDEVQRSDERAVISVPHW